MSVNKYANNLDQICFTLGLLPTKQVMAVTDLMSVSQVACMKTGRALEGPARKQSIFGQMKKDKKNLDFFMGPSDEKKILSPHSLH